MILVDVMRECFYLLNWLILHKILLVPSCAEQGTIGDTSYIHVQIRWQTTGERFIMKKKKKKISPAIHRYMIGASEKILQVKCRMVPMWKARFFKFKWTKMLSYAMFYDNDILSCSWRDRWTIQTKPCLDIWYISETEIMNLSFLSML